MEFGEVIVGWFCSGFYVQYYWDLLVEVQIELYVGDF